MINKGSKIFFTIFFILVISSVIFTYYRYVVLKDFDFFTDKEAFDASLSEE